jgi:ankyrin repeat protein
MGRRSKRRASTIGAGALPTPEEAAKKTLLTQLKSVAKEEVLTGIATCGADLSLLHAHGLPAVVAKWLVSDEADVVGAATGVLTAYVAPAPQPAEDTTVPQEGAGDKPAPATGPTAAAAALSFASELKASHKGKWVEVLRARMAKPLSEELRAPTMAFVRAFIVALCTSPDKQRARFARDLASSALFVGGLATSIAHHELVNERGGWEDSTSLDALGALRTLLVPSDAAVGSTSAPASARTPRSPSAGKPTATYALATLSASEEACAHLTDFASRSPFGWGCGVERELLDGVRDLLCTLASTPAGARSLGIGGLAALVAAVRDDECAAPDAVLRSVAALVCVTPDVEGASAAQSAVAALVRPGAPIATVAAACSCLAAIFDDSQSAALRAALVADVEVNAITLIASYLCAAPEEGADADDESAAASALLTKLIGAAFSADFDCPADDVLASASDVVVAGLTCAAPAGAHAARTARQLLVGEASATRAGAHAALSAAGAAQTLLSHLSATLPVTQAAVAALSAADARAASDGLAALAALYDTRAEAGVAAPGADAIAALGAATHSVLAVHAAAAAVAAEGGEGDEGGEGAAALLAAALPPCFASVGRAAVALGDEPGPTEIYGCFAANDGLLGALCARAQALCVSGDAGAAVESILALLDCAITSPAGRETLLGPGATNFATLHIGAEGAAEAAEASGGSIALVETAMCIIGSAAIAAPIAAAALRTLRAVCLCPASTADAGSGAAAREAAAAIAADEIDDDAIAALRVDAVGAAIEALQQAQIAVQAGVLPTCMARAVCTSDDAVRTAAFALIHSIVGAGVALVDAVNAAAATAAEEECAERFGATDAAARAACATFATSLDAPTPAAGLPSEWAYWADGAPCATPALHAAVLGFLVHAPVVDALIAAGADVDCVDERGATPLLQALLFGVPNAARVLLDAGADPNRTTTSGISALKAAFVMPSRRKLEAARKFAERTAGIGEEPSRVMGGAPSDLLKTLIARGVDVNACDEDGTSALLWAVHGCSVALQYTKDVAIELHASTDAFGPGSDVAARVKALIRAGADVDVGRVVPSVVTPLQAALQRGMVDVAHALLEANANPNVVCSGGVIALHACLRGAVGGPDLFDAIIAAGQRHIVIDAATSAAAHAVRVEHAALDAVTAKQSDVAAVLDGGLAALRGATVARASMPPTTFTLLTMANSAGLTPLHCACGGTDVWAQLQATKSGPSAWMSGTGVPCDWLTHREGGMFSPRPLEDVADARFALVAHVLGAFAAALEHAAEFIAYAERLSDLGAPDSANASADRDAFVASAWPGAAAALTARWAEAAKTSLAQVANAARVGGSAGVGGGFTPVIAAACWDAAFDQWQSLVSIDGVDDEEADAAAEAAAEADDTATKVMKKKEATRVPRLLSALCGVGGDLDALYDVYADSTVGCEAGSEDEDAAAAETAQRAAFANGGDVFTPLAVGLACSDHLAAFCLENGARVDLPVRPSLILLAAHHGSSTALVTALAERSAADALCAQAEPAASRADSRVDLIGAPLHLAARAGHYELVALLASLGADVDAVRSGDRCTPLHLAARNGNFRALQALLAAKCDTTAASADDPSALFAALRYGGGDSGREAEERKSSERAGQIACVDALAHCCVLRCCARAAVVGGVVCPPARAHARPRISSRLVRRLFDSPAPQLSIRPARPSFRDAARCPCPRDNRAVARASRSRHAGGAEQAQSPGRDVATSALR